MGNSESSTQFPPQSNNDGNNNNNNKEDEAKEDEAKKDEGSTSTALKIGAAVAGAALLAFGAYSSISSASSQSDDEYNGRRRATPMQSSEFEASGGSGFSRNQGNQLSYGGPSFPEDAPAEGGTKGGTNEHNSPRMIKIMSYNVWSLKVKDFQINKRMEAIGGLIEQHSPDIIFLQEMTPSIYGMFQSCDWWRLYECSVPPEKANRKYFCMQLSKLPVKKFYCEPFDNSTTGRGLCVAEIDAGAKRKLIAATCHLKAPDDSSKNSEERVSQANEALDFLSKSPNVVFGGDMNWDESSDGQFPLFRGWYDAWSVLRPKEDGYTYDTNSNPMLKHTGPLQARLDRFVYKLKDFEVEKIEMIGTKAIRGIYFTHNGQRLPILPSDHYGLILTICPKQ